jgi:hypothetical protein
MRGRERDHCKPWKPEDKKERLFHEELRPVIDETWSIKNNIHFFFISVKGADQMPHRFVLITFSRSFVDSSFPAYRRQAQSALSAYRPRSRPRAGQAGTFEYANFFMDDTKSQFLSPNPELSD